MNSVSSPTASPIACPTNAPATWSDTSMRRFSSPGSDAMEAKLTPTGRDCSESDMSAPSSSSGEEPLPNRTSASAAAALVAASVAVTAAAAAAAAASSASAAPSSSEDAGETAAMRSARRMAGVPLAHAEASGSRSGLG